MGQVSFKPPQTRAVVTGGGAFDPATLGGTRLWLRAKDLGANGSSVTTWADQSGGAHDVTSGGTAPTVATGATPSSGKAVNFAASGYFSAPSDTLGAVDKIIKSSEYSGEPAQWAFDGTASKWSTNFTTTGWIGAQLRTATALTGYSVTGAGIGQDPKDWLFQGTNDATLATWTTLDTRTGETFSGSAKPYTFTNSTAYSYYRLNVTANNGNGGIMSVVELSFTGYTLAFTAAPSAAEAWIVVKSEMAQNGSNLQGIWSFNSGSAGNAHAFFPYAGTTDSAVYESFGVASATSVFSTGSNTLLNTWRLYRVTQDGTNLKVYLDNELKATVAVSGSSSWPVNAQIGRAVWGTSNTAPFTGKIAELLVRTQVSTTGEVADLITYFNSEHGLTVGALPAAVANWTVTETSGTTVADSIGGVALTFAGSPTPTFVASQLHSHSVLRTVASASAMALDMTGGGTAPEPSTAITAMCWAKTASGGSGFASAMSKATTTYDTYGLYCHYGSGKTDTPACQYHTTNNASGELWASSALLSDHAWHHLAMTYDGASVKLYCDGTQVATASATGTLVYSSGRRFAAMGNDEYGNYFVGDAAEFRIYNVALTQAQITTAMAG